MRNVNPALLGPENECNRIAGANGLAGSVADAVAGLDEFGLSVDHPENVALRTDASACTAAQTFQGIDLRMQRGGFQKAGFGSRRLRRPTARLGPLAQRGIEGPNDYNG